MTTMRRWWVFALVCLALFMGALDSLVVTTALLPLLKAVMHRGRGPQFAGQSVPLNACAQDIDDRLKRLPVRHPGASSFGVRGGGRNQRTDLFPQLIGDFPWTCSWHLAFAFWFFPSLYPTFSDKA